MASAQPGKMVITIILSGAILLATGVTTWTMLRAEFIETFCEFSACPLKQTWAPDDIPMPKKPFKLRWCSALAR